MQNTCCRHRSIRLQALVAMLLVTTSGCGGYGEVSPTTYEFAKALYSIANRQASDALDSVSQQIETARENDEISAREARWLQDIVKMAERGDWDQAGQAARRIVADQVR